MGLVDRFERLLDRIMPPPDEAVRALRRAEALLARGDVRAALSLAAEARRVAPGWLAPWVLWSDALAADGQPAEALRVLDDAAREHELPAEVLGRVAALAAGVGDVARALDVERRTHGRPVLDPRGLAARYLQAAERFEAAGEADAASRFARAATVLDPALPPAWLVLARAALAADDPARARRLLGRAVASLDPSDAPTNHAAGDLAWRLDDRALAARCLRRAWVCGEEGAAPLLVVALTAADDGPAIERVARGLDRALARVVAALGALARGGALDGGDGVAAADIPEALWRYAIELAVRADLPLAVRWAAEAPSRALCAEVLALAEAEAAIDRGEHQGVAEVLALPLASAVTRARAAALLGRSFERAWGSSLDALLAGLAGWLRMAGTDDALAASLDALRRSLDEPLRVAILGEFSAGKSTVVNAWVGAALSAVGVLPTTARVYWLRQGAARARVLDAAGGLREAPIEGLPEALGAAEADGRAVAHVELFHPSAALAHLELIDTPGSNATDGVDPAVTRHALELADLALWIFDARQAGKQSELDALRAVRAEGVPVVGAVNKADVVGEAGMAEVARMLGDVLGDEAPLLGSFGARAVMAGAEAPDWEAFRAAVGERVIGRRDDWKRLRAAVRLRSTLDGVRRARLEGEAVEATRRAIEAQLVDALGALREEVTGRAAQVRREVAASLREQWPSLRGREAAPSEEVLRDVVAELVHRCVQRERAALAGPRGEVEALAVAAGVVRQGLGAVFTAPVDGVIRAAVSDGVRDALDMALRPSTLGQTVGGSVEGVDVGDPWREVSIALDATRSPADVPAVVLAVALEAALRCAVESGDALAAALGVKVPDATSEPKD
ncbi:MAG: dynamin family protein [Deltaproteobacteria bacterium]|nr:dynamin family protein [Myxococcales bacterium]MDP3217497.1 dynamin family protein [Deltaproteobacteria bacterium]